MSPYTIVLADDHMLFRQGVKRIIEENPDYKVIGEAGDGLALLELLKTCSPDLVILDISMPLLRGLEAARELKRTYPKVKILLLTMHRKKDFLQQGIEAGADGFMLKEDADYGLIQAIKAIRKGEKYFSPLLMAKLADEKYDEYADNYPYHHYLIIPEKVDSAICWKIYWGIPENLNKLFPS